MYDPASDIIAKSVAQALVYELAKIIADHGEANIMKKSKVRKIRLVV